MAGVAQREVVLIPVAAGALYPLSGTPLPPIFAAGAMALSSVFVLGNAFRLKSFRPPLAGARQALPSGVTKSRLAPAE